MLVLGVLQRAMICRSFAWCCSGSYVHVQLAGAPPLFRVPTIDRRGIKERPSKRV